MLANYDRPMSVNATVTRPPVASAALWSARVLLAVLGLFVIGGTVYFGFIDPERATDGVFDYILGLWAMTCGVGFVVSAFLLGHGPKIVRAVRILIGAHLVFSVIKIAGGESEVMVMVVADLVILALLHAVTRARTV